MTTQVLAFEEFVAADPSLQARLESAASLEALMQIAQSCGFSLTKNELRAARSEQAALLAFFDALRSDVSLQEQLKDNSDPDSIIAIANQAGFNISIIHLLRAQKLAQSAMELSNKELSDEELGDVSAGITPLVAGVLIGSIFGAGVSLGFWAGGGMDDWF